MEAVRKRNGNVYQGSLFDDPKENPPIRQAIDFYRHRHNWTNHRSFFAALKGGAEQDDGGLERLFITGVSPVTLDDVTSGFNIGTNLSLEPDFNEMRGFTEAEVRGLLELYRDRGLFSQHLDGAMDLMREWYSGYRFAKSTTTDLYNTDMMLYYLQKSMPNRTVPDYLIDTNVRIDYGKLRHLLVINRRSAAGDARLNGNFDLRLPDRAEVPAPKRIGGHGAH